MAFELVIAAKRDPVETADALRRNTTMRGSPSLPVATIDVNGAFGEENVHELARSVADVLHKPADTVIVRFRDIACEDPQSLVNFGRWIEQLRSDGHDVRMAAEESHVQTLLAQKVVSPDAVMEPDEADAVTGRRLVDIHHADS